LKTLGVSADPKGPVTQGLFRYSAFHVVAVPATAYPQYRGYIWGHKVQALD